MAGLTPCVRCGKTRIVGKTWTEKIGDSVLTRTLTVCPDSACQKIVDKDFLQKQQDIQTRQEESTKRREAARNRRKAPSDTEPQ